ncbi:MAG TPA: protein kinase [Thermoanaerobaculia bacterium]|nr:protein kinase [Thermoanaerobaculia bacterium]
MDFSCLSCGKPLQSDYQNCPGCGDAVTDFLREYWNKPLGGDYRLIRKLGRGGMGEVYKAHHIHLDTDCVVKVMRPNLASDATLGERFVREARVARKIQHRNVATLYQFSGLPDGSYYMVWEYIEGQDLGQIIRERGALPPGEVIRISIQALEGLEAIHRAGFVHRDISPDNIMITRDERGEPLVKIIDLGIAKQGTESGMTMTGTGMFIGKLKYASPEHIGFLPEGERIDGRADLYSFALVMYEMLAGKAPFLASTPHEYMIKQAKEPPPPLPPERMAQDLAPELQSVIFKALEKDRKARYDTAEVFAGTLSGLARSGRRVSAADQPTVNLGGGEIPTLPQAPPVVSREGAESTRHVPPPKGTNTRPDVPPAAAAPEQATQPPGGVGVGASPAPVALADGQRETERAGRRRRRILFPAAATLVAVLLGSAGWMILRNREPDASTQPSTQTSSASIAGTMSRLADVVVDSRTGLMWARRDNGSNIDWNGADSYCRSLTTGGHSDWRLPAIDELAAIYESSASPRSVPCSSRYPVKLRIPIEPSCYVAWSSTKSGSSSAFTLYLDYGGRNSNLLAATYQRALCVRGPER